MQQCLLNRYIKNLLKNNVYKINLQKIFFLALEISAHYKKSYFNTNDLVKLANQYKVELVRTRVDKKDYKYLDDTKFGGLRGNFSTLITLKGFVKRGNKINTLLFSWERRANCQCGK